VRERSALGMTVGHAAMPRPFNAGDAAPMPARQHKGRGDPAFVQFRGKRD
jgi:hypothetical protein